MRLITGKWYNRGLLLVIVLLALFGAYAPVKEIWALTGSVAAYALGAADMILEIGIFRKKGMILLNQLIVLAASGAMTVAGDLTGAVAVLVIYLLSRGVSRRMAAAEEKMFDGADRIIPEKTMVYVDGEPEERDTSSVRDGNVVLVRAGDVIPCDGAVFEGTAVLDDSVVTALPGHIRTAGAGDSVLAGSKVESGQLQVVASASAEDSYISRMVKRVRNAAASESSEDRRYAVAARVYMAVLVPVSFAVAFLPPLITGGSDIWLMRGAILLLASTAGNPMIMWRKLTSCFVLGSFEDGVIYRNREILEKTAAMDLVAIDSRITEGKLSYRITEVVAEECTKEELLTYAGHLENRSTHPAGREIYRGFLELAAYEGLTEDEALNMDLVTKFEEIEGSGVSAYLGGMFVCVGNRNLMKLINIRDLPEEDTKEKMYIYVAVDQKLFGYIVLEVEGQDRQGNFYSTWAEAGISKAAVFGRDYAEIISELASAKERKSVLCTVTQDENTGKLTGDLKETDMTVLMGCCGKRNGDCDLMITGDMLAELADVRQSAAEVISLGRIRTAGYMAVRAGFYIAAFAGVIPAWLAFAGENLAALLMRTVGEMRKNI